MAYVSIHRTWQAEEACFRAHRALHLAQFYAASAASASDKGQQQQEEQLAQALALFDRAGALAEEAEALAEEVDARADKARRQGLVDEAAGLRARAKGACAFGGCGGVCGLMGQGACVLWGLERGRGDCWNERIWRVIAMCAWSWWPPLLSPTIREEPPQPTLILQHLHVSTNRQPYLLL